MQRAVKTKAIGIEFINTRVVLRYKIYGDDSFRLGSEMDEHRKFLADRLLSDEQPVRLFIHDRARYQNTD